MSDTTIIQAAAEAETKTGRADPFNENSWTETPIEPVKSIDQPSTPENPAENNEQEQILDANVYLKEQLGFDDWESAKAQVSELRKLKETAQTPAEIKFANEESKKYYEALTGGKDDELYDILHQRRTISRIEKMDVSKASDAAEILKLNLQYKHKDLSTEEVDYLFNRQFAIPSKPNQTEDQTEEEYAQVLSNWTAKVADIERGMIIDAKLAKPELVQYQKELKLPDIPKVAPIQAEPTPEELAQAQQNRDAYFKQVEKGLLTAKGFNATFKDEAVEIPLSYEISSEEKAALKPILESFGNDFNYFLKRWANADGSANTSLMTEDLYLLENKGKVFQKFANESGAQRLEFQLKNGSNIQLGQQAQRTFVPDAQKSNEQKQFDTIWAA